MNWVVPSSQIEKRGALLGWVAPSHPTDAAAVLDTKSPQVHNKTTQDVGHGQQFNPFLCTVLKSPKHRNRWAWVSIYSWHALPPPEISIFLILKSSQTKIAEFQAMNVCIRIA